MEPGSHEFQSFILQIYVECQTMNWVLCLLLQIQIKKNTSHWSQRSHKPVRETDSLTGNYNNSSDKFKFKKLWYRGRVWNWPGRTKEDFLEEVILELILNRWVSFCKMKKGRGCTGEEKKLIQIPVKRPGSSQKQDGLKEHDLFWETASGTLS